MPWIPPALAAWIVLLTLLTGCQSIIQRSPSGSTEMEMIPVQIRPAHGKVKQVSVPWQPNMRLQEVVENGPAFKIG